MTESFNENDPITEDKAKEAWLKAREVKEKACSAAIEVSLKEYGCILEVTMLITGKGNIPQIQVRARE